MTSDTQKNVLYVYEYSIDKLVELFEKHSKSKKEEIQTRNFTGYFDEYFRELKAKTIVVEKEYVDGDYLDDFSAYYVKCFNRYKRKCTRLHFFSFTFGEAQFLNMLDDGYASSEFSNKCRKQYIGYIVVKPLPKTIIGRTCIRTYPEIKSKTLSRYFPITKTCSANLFGLSLSIDSLPFQEQDQVVAACSTSALWSVFHGTSPLFHHKILSPAEITSSATQNLPSTIRSFPNYGLMPEQMAAAIRSVGLEPVYENLRELGRHEIQSLFNAYLSAGIPVLFGFNLKTKTNISKGHHAVAVTGYGIDSDTEPISTSSLPMKSSKMNKFYVHDDQIGPFARMEFEKNNKTMSTHWKIDDDQCIADPEILFVPVYHKIRIPYKIIENVIEHFNSFLAKTMPTNFNKFEWHIFLTTINDFKQNIWQRSEYSERRILLLKRLPKYLWCARCAFADVERIDILFDATDIEQGGLGIQFAIYDENFFEGMKRVIEDYENNKGFTHNFGAKKLTDAILSRD